MKLLFATNNAHKLEEIQSLLPSWRIISPSDLGVTEEIPEDGDTLEANSLQKAQYLSDKTGFACFADDTGLEVEALDGAPGVYSARYAGETKDSEANMKKLLKDLEGKTNTKARFRTVITLIDSSKRVHVFEGIVNGEITRTASGEKGFGYDPIFKPEGYNCTFAEMTLADKNAISHRARAMQKLVEYLNSNRI